MDQCLIRSPSAFSNVLPMHEMPLAHIPYPGSLRIYEVQEMSIGFCDSRF